MGDFDVRSGAIVGHRSSTGERFLTFSITIADNADRNALKPSDVDRLRAEETREAPGSESALSRARLSSRLDSNRHEHTTRRGVAL